MIALLDTTESVLKHLRHVRNIVPDLRRESKPINDALATIAKCRDIPPNHPIWGATQGLLAGVDAILAYVQEVTRPDPDWYEVYIRERTHFNINQVRNGKAAERLRDRRKEGRLADARIRVSRRSPTPTAEPKSEAAPAAASVEELKTWASVLATTRSNMHKGASADEVLQHAMAWAIEHAATGHPLPPDTPEELGEFIERRKQELREREDEEAMF
jgi:hypothetical protein